MNMKKININIFDSFALAILIVIIFVVILGLSLNKTENTKETLLTIKVEREADTIYPKAQKLGDVYFDSVNSPVKAVKAVKNGNALEIILSGPGEIEKDRYIFNGMRVLVGQKAEIHGTYFAQGVITEVKYENSK